MKRFLLLLFSGLACFGAGKPPHHQAGHSHKVVVEGILASADDLGAGI